MTTGWISLAAGLAAATLCLGSGASAQSFEVQVGPGCGTSSGVSATPVTESASCGSGGANVSATAAALFGHVGGTTSASIGSGYFGSSFGINTSSIFTDYVTFTSDDPAATTALIAANLAFSGSMNSTSYAFTSMGVFYSMDGASGFYFFGASQDGVTRNDFLIAEGSVSSTFSDALFRTSMFLVPLNTPMLITLRLDTGASVGGSGSPESATSAFSNSFEIPLGMDAFVLPFGVTANSGTWLVDNRRIGLVDSAVPEPATWAMMILGFGLTGFGLRRRPRLAVALA